MRNAIDVQQIGRDSYASGYEAGCRSGFERLAQTGAFEANFADHIGLARRILASVPDEYTEAQLDDIGRRARHWVIKAYCEWRLENGN